MPPPSANYSARLTAFKRDLTGVDSNWLEVVRSNFLNQANTYLASWTNVTFADESVTAPADRVVELKLPATAKGYTFQAPPEWGERAAPGRLQSLLSDMVQIEADLSLAVGDYDALIGQIENKTRMLVEVSTISGARAW